MSALPLWLVLLSLSLYTAVLFGLAHWGERRGHLFSHPTRHVVYGLALVVYCTSWTFYGAVGTAARSGWDYLPIYLGPALVFTIGLPVLRKLVRVGRAQQVTSISSFLGGRYGKSQGLAALVTVIATLGALPYIALQLKAVSTSLAMLTITSAGSAQAPNDRYVLVVALTLAAFAVLFGTRHADVTRPNRGMMLSLAAQTLFKLAALGAVAIFAATVMAAVADGPSLGELLGTAPVPPPAAIDGRFLALTFLGATAVFCLPRQFHVTVVECEEPRALGPAAAVVLLAMALVSLAVLPIASLGRELLTRGGQAGVSLDPDLLVVALPLQAGQQALALVAFLGGFAAATSMVIVATVALSLMIAHDIIAPLLVRRQLRVPGHAAGLPAPARGALLPAQLLVLRQLVILGLMLLAFLHYLGLDKSGALSGLGVTSFSAVAQFAPAVAGALYWRRAHRLGVWLGLTAGMLAWAWWFGPAEGVAPAARAATERFLGLTDPLTAGVVVSLGLNSAAFLSGSLLARPNGLDRRQALAFVAGEDRRGRASIDEERVDHPLVTAGALRALLQRVVGEPAAEEAIRVQARLSGAYPDDDEPASSALIAWHESQLARVVGTSSARLLLRSAVTGERMQPGDVLALIDETSQQVQRSQRALEESERSISFYLDNVPALIIFVAPDERVVFANRAYRELFQRGDSDIVGRTARDYLSPAEYLERQPYIRQAMNGRRVQFDITMRVPRSGGRSEAPARSSQPDSAAGSLAAPSSGAASDGGATDEGATDLVYYQVTYVPQWNHDGTPRGFFGLYQDVTARREAERALRETNESLEERVRSRTAALSQVNEALRLATEEAERATRSKTRFLAAASHDLLQPLNAARLFTSALQASVDPTDTQTRELTESIDKSIRSADRLLRALLDISKLDAGGLKPDFTVFPLADLLDELRIEFAARAVEKGLALRLMPCSLSIRSDRGLLLSVLQNLVSNAVRYTDRGRVLVGVRRRGANVSIQVWDSGRGIPADKQREIFGEFHQLERDARLHDSGVGLGLAITERIAKLLGHPLHLQSREGRGSCFSLEVPVAEAGRASKIRRPASAVDKAAEGSVVWCVDDDPDVLDALSMLLERWGYRVRAGRDMDQVGAWLRAERSGPNILLLDYQLGQGETGFDVLDLLTVHGQRPDGVAMLTAVTAAGELRRRASERGVTVLRKPVDPAALRAFIVRAVSSSRRAAR